ncbi:MAG: hypothetical protein IKH00_04245 [Bacteroidales bacterium]|nr:hypothetical protein [Bacteroidales bacterium]
MRKSLICLAALLIGVASLSAQNNGQSVKTQPQDTTQKVKTEVPKASAQKAAKETTKKVADSNRNKMYVSLQGGGLVSLNENYRIYGENGKNSDLLTGQGSAAFGYRFTPVSGVRVWAGYAGNRSACNTKETSGHRFYPYKFNSINAFVDYVMDFSGFSDSDWTVVPKLYAGIGLGNTSGFEKTPDNPAPGNQFHPWQKVSEKNTAFGFRGGLILEFMVSQSFGILADFGGEFYTDGYNGLNPGKEVSESGDKNFPLDFRGVASLGVAIHF